MKLANVSVKSPGPIRPVIPIMLLFAPWSCPCSDGPTRRVIKPCAAGPKSPMNAPLAEARDYTFDQPGLHNNVEYSDDRQRQPGRGRIPAVAKAGVEHEDRITGLRPKRSESAPSTGEKINCISAQTVPNSPKISAARAVSPPRKPSTSFGSTGMMIPNARTSTTTVMKMKTSAAARAFATDFVSATGFK